MFSAPASYLAIPIERMFGALKAKDFDSLEPPHLLKQHLPRAKRFTHIQKILSQISDYLFNIKQSKVQTFFRESLRKLEVFLTKEKI